MTNQTFAVVGKVMNGRISIVVATTDKVVGYSRPIIGEREEMRMNRITEQTYMDVPKHTPAIKKVEDVEVPSFMKQYSQQLREARNPKPTPKRKTYNNLINRLHDIRE